MGPNTSTGHQASSIPQKATLFHRPLTSKADMRVCHKVVFLSMNMILCSWPSSVSVPTRYRSLETSEIKLSNISPTEKSAAQIWRLLFPTSYFRPRSTCTRGDLSRVVCFSCYLNLWHPFKLVDSRLIGIDYVLKHCTVLILAAGYWPNMAQCILFPIVLKFDTFTFLRMWLDFSFSL